MFTHALNGRSHTFLKCSIVTDRPSATKRRHGRNTAPFNLAITRHESSSSKPLRRAKHPTPPMMNTFRTALHETAKISSATDIAAGDATPRAGNCGALSNFWTTAVAARVGASFREDGRFRPENARFPRGRRTRHTSWKPRANRTHARAHTVASRTNSHARTLSVRTHVRPECNFCLLTLREAPIHLSKHTAKFVDTTRWGTRADPRRLR